MAELKTKETDADVKKYLDSVIDEKKRHDSYAILEMMAGITGAKPKLWGDSIIGFGNYRYKYSSGREGDWFLTGFAPRKQNISLYLMAGYVGSENSEYEKLLQGLGKFKMGKGCVYINKLEDIDKDRLQELIRLSVEYLKSRYKAG
jgi:hypothetical protein